VGQIGGLGNESLESKSSQVLGLWVLNAFESKRGFTFWGGCPLKWPLSLKGEKRAYNWASKFGAI